MTKSWERRGNEVTYTVRLDSDQRLEFDATGPGTRGTERAGPTGAIWVEEFPDSERWQRWVRQNLGGSILAELQKSVTSELETLYATRKQAFSEAVERLDSDDEEERRAGLDRMRSLAERYDDLVGPALERFVELLVDGEDDVRRTAAESIRKLARSHPAAVEEIRDELGRALNDDHPNVRLDAARALVLIADAGRESEQLDTIVESLVGLLHEHKRWFSQGPVAGLLGDLGRKHPEALEPAIEPLARFIQGELRGGSGTSGLGRSSAVQALVEIGARRFELIEDHTEVFFEKLDAPRPGVRGQCAEALGVVGAERPDLAERCARALAGRLDDTRFVRTEAVDALRRIHAVHPEPVETALDDDASVLEHDESSPFEQLP